MSGLRLRKLVRDVWVARTRMAMMIIAIAVSVIAVTAFLSARAIMGREMDHNYLDTHPASATLNLPGGVDQATLDAVRAQPDVLDAAARTSVSARVKVGDQRWQIMLLFVTASADPRRISTVAVQQGSWPPPTDGLIFERTALPFLGVQPGDTVVVQTPNGPPTPMTVSGSAHDGGVAPAEQEQTAYGYLTSEGLARLGEPATLTQMKIVVGDRSGPSADRVAIADTAQRVSAMLAARGQQVDHIEIPPPLRHPHQGQMVMVGFILLAFGLTSLLLSAILVATMLGGLLTAQIRQIGAMKAIGARTSQILSLYLLLTAAIAAVATGLALAPGLLLGRVLAGQAAGLLNLDLSSTAAPGWVYAVVLAAGLGVPLLVALPPLVRGSRVTVREAIDDHGADPAAVTGTRLERRLGRLRGPSREQLLALRNLFRRRGRLALSVGMLAMAGAMFLTGLNTAGGWAALVDQGVAHRHYDLEVRLSHPQDAARVTDLVRQLPGVVDAEAWGRVPTTVHTAGQVDVTRVYPDDSHASFTVLAPPADTPLLRLPLKAGRWLRPDDTDAVVLNNLVPAQQAPGITVGDTITLTIAGHPGTWRVVGIASDFGTQGTVYLTDTEYAHATAGTAGAGAQLLRVVTARHDTAGRQAALAQIEQALGGAGIGIEQDLTVDTLQAGLDGHVLVLAEALVGIAILVGFVGLLGLASTMTTNVVERTREFAIMRVIGATTSSVHTVVVTEGVLTGGLSIILALIAALPLTRVLGDFIGMQAFRQTLPFQFSGSALLLWTIVALAGAAVASVTAARRAASLTVREALTTL
jgi:putative ABC transport system permease protein